MLSRATRFSRLSCLFCCSPDHPDLHSFPTRRSSDLLGLVGPGMRQRERHVEQGLRQLSAQIAEPERRTDHADPELLDRKSTRLNSSHRCISYAVFCLKKKKTTN